MEQFETIAADVYRGELEQAGTYWIRARWHIAEGVWMPCLAGPVTRLRAFDASSVRFSNDELAKALLAAVDERRTGDEDINRARLSRHRPRPPQSRLRPNMQLKQLFGEWQAGNKPRPQTSLEYEAAVDDFIDFAGDIAVSTIDPDLL